MKKKNILMGTLLAAMLVMSSACAAPLTTAKSAAAPIATATGRSDQAAERLLEAMEPLLPTPEELTLRPLHLTEAFSLDTLLTATATGDKELNLSIPTTLRITRPAEDLTTTYATYFITGTSDPGLPLYFEGEEIIRQGTKGTFGVLVNLEMGSNAFSFTQGDKRVSAFITRKKSSSAPLTIIQQSSMFPAVQGGAKVGGTIPVRCIAPAGAEVTASFGGKSVSLTQVAAASPGIPATFTGKLTVAGDYASGVTTRAGAVTYTLRHNGETTSYKSSGEMFIAGEGAGIAIRVTEYAGFVYPDLDDLSQIREKVKAGAADYIIDQNNSYFKLSSGGWVSTDRVKIIEGETKVSSTLKGAESDFDTSRETYTFSATRFPFYYSRVSDGAFYLTFYNTSGTPKPSVTSSKLFSSVSASEKENGSVVYAFKLKESASVWGYDVAFEDGTITLQFNYRPRLSTSTAKPLDGIRILLDPGHGGTDPGALGVAGLTGPYESTINLAHAYAVRDKLTSLGAKVMLTTNQDIYFSLDDRIKTIEDWDADLYLSIHHNSIGETADANKAAGMEVYYHTGYSKRLANSMMEGLSANLNRNNRFVSQSYFRVTLMPYAPAILMELGYMSNPLEYEKATTQSQINQVAEAIADGVQRALKA
jgi:N-acetylmuramoyl-L-alanine amidase